MSASDKDFQLGLAMMEAARPDGHTWPSTEFEWGGAVAALEQMGVPDGAQGAVRRLLRLRRVGLFQYPWVDVTGQCA